ncbi:MAG: dihydrofolate reductase family protein [Candidatus Dormibacteria bacterium]
MNQGDSQLPQLQLLFQAPDLGPALALGEEISDWYGGPLRLPDRGLYANFVTSLDGVAVVGDSSGSRLSGRSQADRLVMGVLRSVADAIVIGSGTLRGSPAHRWTPEHVFPPGAGRFAALREQLALSAEPRLVVISGSGRIELGHPGLSAGALVLTSQAGAERLGAPPGLEVTALGEAEVLPVQAILAELRRRGHARLLSEAGPTLFGRFLAAEVLSDLFLTLAPRLVGRTPEQPRAGMVAGVDLLAPGREPIGDLLSARRDRSLLFLHYRLPVSPLP